jgi:hypothetical protein
MSEETRKIRLMDDQGNISTLTIRNGSLQVGSAVADLDSHWEASIPSSGAILAQLGARVASTGRRLRELAVQNTGETLITADVYSSCFEHLNIQAGEVTSLLEKGGFIYILYAGGALQKVNRSSMQIVSTLNTGLAGTCKKLLADDTYLYVLANRSDPNPAEITRVSLASFTVGDTLALDTDEFVVDYITLFDDAIYYIPSIANKKICKVALDTFVTSTKVNILGASACSGLVVDEVNGLIYITYTNASDDQLVQVEDAEGLGTKTFIVMIDPSEVVAFTSNVLMVNNKICASGTDTGTPKLYEVSISGLIPQIIWEGQEGVWAGDGDTVVSVVAGELVIEPGEEVGSATASGLTLDLSDAASMKMHYTGEGSGATINLIFRTSEGNEFTYQFTDSAMIERMLDVALLDFTPTGTPDWASITEIAIESIDVGVTIKVRRLLVDGMIVAPDRAITLTQTPELLFASPTKLYSVSDEDSCVKMDVINLVGYAVTQEAFETITNFKDAITVGTTEVFMAGGDVNFVEAQLLKSTVDLFSDIKKLRVDALPGVVSNWQSIDGRMFPNGSLIVIKTLTAEISGSGVE